MLLKSYNWANSPIRHHTTAWTPRAKKPFELNLFFLAAFFPFGNLPSSTLYLLEVCFLGSSRKRHLGLSSEIFAPSTLRLRLLPFTVFLVIWLQTLCSALQCVNHLGSCSEQCIWGGAWDAAFLTSSHGMPMLLACRQPFEEHVIWVFLNVFPFIF